MPEFLALPLIGSLLDFGLGMSSTNKTNAANERINERQLQVAQEMQQRNFDYQREMFNAENAWNSPVNQSALYKQAGINPLMALSQGNSFAPASAGSGDSGSVPSQTPMMTYQPSLGRDVSSVLSNYFSGRVQQEQAANISADTDYKMQSLRQRVLKDYYDVMNSDLDSQTKKVLKEQYQRQLDFFNDTYQSRQHQVNQDSNIAFENAQRLERENYEATITQAVRLAQQESGLRISWQQEKNLVADLTLLWQKANTEKWTQKRLQAEESRIVQDRIIHTPEQRQAENTSKLYENPTTNKAEWFLDEFNRFMERVNPVQGLFKFSK